MKNIILFISLLFIRNIFPPKQTYEECIKKSNYTDLGLCQCDKKFNKPLY